MARFGMMNAQALAANTAAPGSTVNKAGGEAYAISNPSLRLLTMIGSSFWNEPQYYGDAPEAERIDGLSDESTRVVATAREVARSENPRDLLALALWARTEMNVRTTPQVLLAVAAAEPATKRFVRAYTPRVVQRADEIRQAFAAYLALHAKGVAANAHGQKLPNSLKRGLADAFERFSEAQIMKYDSDVRPTFRDVLRMVDRGKDWPLPQALQRYLLTGEVTDPGAMPTVAARKALAKKTSLDEEARVLIRASHANWEVVVSQFGSRKDVWEAVLPQMGYMALLRNLRNLAQAGVDLAPALARIADPRAVAESRQLPFRFYTAYRMMEVGGLLTTRVADALEDALAHATGALPKLPGVTVVAADNSGSMDSPLSAQSVVTRRQAANLLAAITMRRCDEGHVVTFADTAALVPIASRDGLVTNATRVTKTSVGGSTNAHAAVELMIERRLRADRLIVFSDMQCWNSAGTPATLAGAVRRYRSAVNASLVVHSVDLAGYGLSAVVPDDPRTHLVSGTSEKVLRMIADFEAALAGNAAKPDARERPRVALPTLEDIRARY